MKRIFINFIMILVGIVLGFAVAIAITVVVTGDNIFISSSEPSIPLTSFETAQSELALVAADLSTYDYLSPQTQELMINSLEAATKRFPVPIGLMHAVSRTESEYRFWIDHPTVTTTVKGKRVTTHAIGIGGIIWEFWGDSLQYYDIAHSPSDLYIPDVAIEAQACVLHIIIRDVMRSHSIKEGNIISRIQSQYYGAYSDLYMSRIQKVTSDLWMKRMAREIEDVYIKEVKESTVDTVPVADADSIAIK